MFLTCCSPRSSNATSSLSRTWSYTTRLTQMPPGSASASRRAATLTPSPKMSRPSRMMSPRLMPMRNSIRFSSGTAVLRSVIPCCTSTAQRTASTTLANSMSNPSPVVLTMRPRCSLTLGSPSSRRIAFSAASVPSSSAPISREYPATSAARMAARRRVWLMSARRSPGAGPKQITRDARGGGMGSQSAQLQGSALPAA